MSLFDYDPALAKPPAALMDAAQTHLPTGLDRGALVQVVPFDNQWPDGVTWSLRLKVPGDSKGDKLQITTTYDSTDQSFDLIWVNVDHRYRNNGVAAIGMRNLVACADDIGVRHINIAATTQGASAWLRFGFTPDQNDWADPVDGGLREKLARKIMQNSPDITEWGTTSPLHGQSARQLFDMAACWTDEWVSNRPGNPADIRVIMNLHQDATGEQIEKEIMKGIGWHGSIDLDAHHPDRQFFNDYINRKCPATPHRSDKKILTAAAGTRHKHRGHI